MFSANKVSSVYCQNAKRFYSSCVRKEVFVSQSRDLLSNVALEDWVGKNVNLKTKTLLILSNNVTKSSGVDIKATLLDAQTFWKVKDFEELVLSSLPSDLPLKSIPNLEINHDGLDPGSQSYSIHLNLSEDVKTKTVLQALETIGKNFLKTQENAESENDGLAHLSLVRPDDGWFPGLEKIRTELEDMFSQVEKLKTQQLKIRDKKKRVSRGYSQIQNSFGQ
eukprot:GFUD01023659.1.p1 GENE.GFUD01023659.1~~GFUD01023659.1.p1  ORF type:complete len:222 (-),score=55.37 GFUD01023659.1:508-1173(-)